MTAKTHKTSFSGKIAALKLCRT